MNEQEFGFTIKVVAERTGVSTHTLRAWERRYGVPKPKRGADNRYRLYAEDDIADVLWLKQQVESGIPPAQASALLRQRREQPRAFASAEASQPIAAMQIALQDAFTQADEVMARQILDEAFALFTPEQVALQIIEPAMKEIGERWMRNEMSVWQEHLASNIVRQKILAVLQSQYAPPLAVPYVVAACAPAEEHELGLLIFTLLARWRGWRAAYLGQGTPLADISHLARQTHPNVIAISITTVLGLAGLVTWLLAKNRPSTPLVFGGRLVNQLPSLREHLPGAFLGEDAEIAVRDLSLADLRKDYWTPSARVWNAVASLRAYRLTIAGDTTARFMNALPARLQPDWDATDLNFATLFLVDSLGCALAFDVPELMDHQNQWLQDAMPPRAVHRDLVVKHLEVFVRILEKTFSKEQNRLFKPLVARMANHSENSEGV
jgi:MerR family transcriptional regulator, light-induced transcriptional regulator